MSNSVPTQPRPRPTGLIVALVVLVIVAVGLGGWLVFGPGGLATGTPTTQGGTSPSPAPSTVVPTGITPTTSAPSGQTPAPSPDSLAATVQFDPLQGDAASAYDSIAVFGVWDGVAVIRLANQTTGDTLRGFDIRTGELQWTLSPLPDGSAFMAAGTPGVSPDVPLHWNGTMAVVLQKLLGPDEQCPAGAYIEIVPLRLDRPTVSTYVDSGCTTPESGSPEFTLPRLEAYEDGIVVVNRWQAGQEHNSGPVPGAYLATMAYANTDLTQELWHVDGPRDMATDEGAYATDPLLWHTLALTAAGTYVDLHDGTPSTFAVGGATYFQVGDGVVELPTSDPALNTVTWWNSPADTQPAWTSSFEPGWSLQPGAWCASSGVLVVQAGNGAPTGEAVALSLEGGDRLWSVSGLPANTGSYASPCAVNTVNPIPVVVFGGRVGTFYDASTGAASPDAAWQGPSPDAGSATGVFQCKGALTCVVWDTGGPSLDAAALQYIDGAPPAVAWSLHLRTLEQYSPYPSVFSYESGMVAVGQATPGQYVIVDLTGK